MKYFDDLVEELNCAAVADNPFMDYKFKPGFDYKNLLDRMTKEERKIIQGKLPVTQEKADAIISKIDIYEKEIADYDFDEIVGELFFGQYVVPSTGFPEYRMFEAYEKSLELGRPLTDEEMEEFRIDFSKDDTDD